MRSRCFVSLLVCLAVPFAASRLGAQDILVPAGTLLRSTMSEPNFSSATVQVGDPVLCHLGSVQQFGHNAFPRGAYMTGHLEGSKDPGHFWGKGYLRVVFDRIGTPNADINVSTKIIGTRNYPVNKDGDIKGKGHPKRDVVEWMIPPLWPWKVLMLPARGPRPTLTGEEPLQLRLMDDIVVPRALATQFDHPDRPPYASSSTRPSNSSGAQPSQTIQPATAGEQLPLDAKGTLVNTAMELNTPDPKNEPTGRVTALVLISNRVLLVTKYRTDGGVINYRAVSGTEGSVDEAQVNWRKTTELTSEMRSADRPMLARRTN